MEPNRDTFFNQSPSDVRFPRSSYPRQRPNGSSARTEPVHQRMIANQQTPAAEIRDSSARQALSTPHTAPNRITQTSSQPQQRSGLMSLSPSNGERRYGQNSSSAYELPQSILPSVFRDGTTDVSMLRNVLNDLRTIQNMANGRHRFHLFLESEQGEVSSPTSERFKHVVTRVLFSPSVSVEHMGNTNQFQALARMLNGISWDGTSDEAMRAVTNSRRRRRQRDTGTPQNIHVDPEVPDQEVLPYRDDGRTSLDPEILREDEEWDQNDSRQAPFSNVEVQNELTLSITRRPLPNSSVASWFACHRNDVEFPTWFPFEEKEYTFGPQITGEPLYVTKEAVDNFEVLETQQIQWIYRELFEFLFREAKRKKRRGIPGVFKYACFTPPWFRSQIIKGKLGDYANQSSVYFSNVVVPDMRNQRSRMGATRLAYILGAFLQREPAMTRKAFLHLLRVVPVNPSLQKPQSRTRVGYALPVQSNTPPNNATKRRRTVNETCNDDERAPPDARAHNRTDMEREDRANPPSGRTSLHNTIDVNGRADDLRPSTRIQASHQPLGKVARRIQDEPIDVDNEDNARNSQIRSARRRVDFDTGRRSDIGEGESARMGQDPVLRRRIPRLFSSDNSVSDEEMASNGTRGDEVSERSHDEEEKDLFEEDEEDGESYEIVGENTTSREGPTRPEAGAAVRVVCAFGQQCRFRNSAMMQDSRYMLMKCRKCLRKIHDLCNGGEHGGKLCPACEERQNQNEMSLQ